MNKFAEQFNNDVITRYQQKMAGLVKIAEEEIPNLIPLTPEEQTSTPYSNRLRDMSPEEAMDALAFESSIVRPLTRQDSREPDLSKVTGELRGIPARAAESAMEMGAGIQLPKINTRGKRYPTLQDQMDMLDYDPYGKGFFNDILKYRSKFDPMRLHDPNNGRQLSNNTYLNPRYDINDALREQGNFYPEEWTTPDMKKINDVLGY